MDPIRNGRFAGLIGLLLLLHAALLTQILHRAPGQFLDVEEGFVAFAASEFLRGPTEVWNSYIYSDYETGTLFVGLLTAQSFRLFGENVLALKLVSIGLSLVTVATTVLLGARLFDRVTGLLGGLFVALGPAPWLIRGIQTLGDSSEGVLFILLQWLVWTFLRSSSGRRRAALGVLLGLVCGMGLAFSLATLPSLLLIVLALISCRRELGHTSMGGWFAGLLLGLSLPLYNLHTLQMSFVSWRGMPLHQMIATPEEWWGATRGLLSREKLNQFSLGLAVSEGSTSLMVWVLRAYWLTVLAAWVACFWPARKNPADRLLVSLHGVYLAAYVFNRHANPYLLLLIVPSGALLFARCLRRLWGVWHWRSGLVILCACGLCVLELLPWKPLYGRPVLEGLADQRMPVADSWWWRLQPWSARWQVALVQTLEEGKPMPPMTSTEAYNVGLFLGSNFEPVGVLHRLDAAMPRTSAEKVAAGYGYGAGWNLRGDELLTQLADQEGPLVNHLLFGLGHALAERYWLELDGWLKKAQDQLTREQHRRHFIRGMGFGHGLRFWFAPQRICEIRDLVPQEHWLDFYLGLVRRLWQDHPIPRQEKGLLAYPLATREFPAELSGYAQIEIPALLMHEGNLRRLPERGEVIDGGQHPAYAGYHFRVQRSGWYTVWLRYATQDPRPVKIQLDGQWVIGPSAGLATGGFTREARLWVRLQCLYLSEGAHQLGVQAVGLFPHLAQIRLVADH